GGPPPRKSKSPRARRMAGARLIQASTTSRRPRRPGAVCWRCTAKRWPDHRVPELPEVERVRRTLAPAMAGARFDGVQLNRRDLRQPFPTGFARRLKGQSVRALVRRGKYLLRKLSSGATLVMPLGI